MRTIIAIFLVGLLWLMVIPMWHTPDEQAHFGQVAFMAEMGRMAKGQELDLTSEIYISEVLLGTARDELGNNKFTFHPDYKLNYTEDTTGIYEASIAALAKRVDRNVFVKSEATRYPPLYYTPASILYRLLGNQDLFVRVYAVRFWSLLLFIVNIYIVFRLGTTLFPTGSIYPFLLTVLVGLHPMMVFANIGVTSDTLGNLLFSMFLFLCVHLIVQGISVKKIIFLCLTILLSLYSKPQFIVMVPLSVVLAAILLFPRLTKRTIKRNVFIMIVISLLSMGILLFLRTGPASTIYHVAQKFDFASFMKFTREYTFRHTIGEVLPWYWGIYDWLGVTYPRTVHRIINRILLVCAVGFIVWCLRIIRYGLHKDPRIQSVLFLIITQVVFYAGIVTYDWLSWYTTTYPLGVQGRYLFPTMSIQMTAIIIGASALISSGWRWRPVLIGTLPIFMIGLNIVALFTVIRTYYDYTSLSTLILRVSQYKPWFAKEFFFVAAGFATIVSVGLFIIWPLVKRFNKKDMWPSLS